MCAAHLHGIGQLGGAVDCGDKGAADEHSVSAQSQRLEHIHAGADTAVHQNLHAAAFEGFSDLRQDLGGGGALIQHTAAVVGDHDGSSTGFLGLEGPLDGHHTLDDEGALGQLDDLGQLGNALAAGGRGHVPSWP